MGAKKKLDIVGLGEIMLRLNFSHTEGKSIAVEKQVLGSELDVVAGTSFLGLKTGFISCLPGHEITKLILDYLRAYGIAEDYILIDKHEDAKLGLFFSKSGRFPTKADIVYNRKTSVIKQITSAAIPEKIYSDTRLFYTSSITLSLSENTYKTGLELMRRFKNNGVFISFDINYESSFWTERVFKTALTEILPLVDVAFISERPWGVLLKTTELKELMKSICRDYGISIVAAIERPKLKIKRTRLRQELYYTVYDSRKDSFRSEYLSDARKLNLEVNKREACIANELYNFLNKNL